ncbi:hypothetical protein L202_05120 [Cryptococcus amylolentus CBS 6039]|uniref:Endonuclease/exonuclease/phosphatase domain-containing protein n=1 Tax=Cryptococcus amylolentus CBS 6039 TaxID=1295533 RepID=A0A1E3HNX3_9TREE|nr:hypothetical protein L202_05120 [Cryptococcus amylolentus CBS 6039]ODN78037.1 hypothetical protein L202_05120 [Cryptococcus amylolentus CBS 6039]
MAPPYVPTPEQAAVAEKRRAERAAKKAAIASGAIADPNNAKGEGQGQGEGEVEFLKRDWVDVGPGQVEGGGGGEGRKRKGVRILTWNLLAQTLVRRKLFPGSDCLKWGDRKALLLAEMAHHGSCDIICLQECDKHSEISTALPKHTFVKGTGPHKSHGLVILYNKEKFGAEWKELVHLDFEDLHSPSQGTEEEGEEDLGEIKRRKGGSRMTKNVGLIVGLKSKNESGRGIVVATTHLFWHPMYAYERTRQALLLVRAIRRFQGVHGLEGWPVVFAGDLNTQPSESTYSLLTSPHSPLPASYAAQVESSRIVHDSLKKMSFTAPRTSPVTTHADASIPPGTPASGTSTPTPVPTKTDEEKDEDREDKKDDSTANSRAPLVSDGIPTTEEMVGLYREVFPGRGCESAYGSTGWRVGRDVPGFGARGGFGELEEGGGGDEPGYTCFTPLFKLTLDYLLLLPPLSPSSDPEASFSKVLLPPRAEELGEGLPRKGICASDHVAVGCEVVW